MNRFLLKPVQPSLLLAVVFSLCAFSQSAGAESHNSKPASYRTARNKPNASASALRKINAEVIRTTTAYKASLEKLLAIYEGEAENLTREVEKRKEFYQKGYIAKRELEETEEELAHVERNVSETRQRISDVNLMLTETGARDELLRAPPLAAGGYSETAQLIRFNGGANWSLAGAGKVERFFKQTFGHALPVSALGQTAVHDRLGFDHHDAMDVALHPDSPEGRTLMAYLRRQGIPFIAFRGKVAGSATAAHIHIGKPSLRLASPLRPPPL